MQALNKEQMAALRLILGAPETVPAKVDLRRLAEPFHPDAVSWRVGSTTKDKARGMALAYIDSRDVQDRLDDVMGPANWRDEYSEVCGFIVCKLWLKVDGEWVWKCDGAGKTDVEGEKGMVSDAFKRAAVKWGIGRYLYSLDSPWVELEAKGNSHVISAAGKATLRNVLGKQWKAYYKGCEGGPSQPPPRAEPQAEPESKPEPSAPPAAKPTPPNAEKPAQSAPSAPRPPVLVGDGAGRMGLDSMHAKLLGVTRDLAKYSTRALKGLQTKVDNQWNEWLEWADAERQGMTDAQRAQVERAVSMFDAERRKVSAAIAAGETAQEQTQEPLPAHDPQTGELLPEASEAA